MSVIIPVLNGAAFLPRCLEALGRSSVQPLERLVVDDGSTDGSAQIAADQNVAAIPMKRSGGPAAARNLGASRASGDVLVFIDADVRVHPDTLERIQRRFEAEPDLDALIGSYDHTPAAPGFVSQYKNLLNHYFHQCGKPEASTFWSACGAIRREAFQEVGGFDESYAKPSVEDIDLGYRLRLAGRRIALDAAVQVQHLKVWTLVQLVRSDVFERALPWTRLILRSGRLPNDLNVGVGQRISALLVWASVIFAAAGGYAPLLLVPAVTAAAAAAALNRRLFGMLAARKGWVFAAAALPLYFTYYLYSSVAFAGMALYVPGWREERRPGGAALRGKGCPESRVDNVRASV